MNIKPVLIFAYGNISRGDDGLGPALLDKLRENSTLNWSQIEFLSDFQLQIEHALDLEHRQLVLFVDASVGGSSSFQFQQLTSQRETAYTTHAMSPAAVLQVYQSIKKQTPPPGFLLTISAEQFELGEGLSDAASANLQSAYDFSVLLLKEPCLIKWLGLVNNA